MKPFLLGFIAFLVISTVSAQKQTVFEQEALVEVLPKIEQFYQVHFSYADELLQNKKVSVVLDKIVSIQDITHTLSFQTQLNFQFIDKTNIVITSFKKSDRITVCGQLFVNNEPLSNASLQVDNNFYSSNTDGSFTIKNISYNSEITIYSFGIEKTVIQAKKHIYPNCNIITLIEKKEQLDQVVIQDYLTGGISKNVKQTTFNTKKLKVLPGLIEPDVLESINQLPGVSNISETVNGIYVRGGNADQNLVLWNNIKTYGNAHLFGTVSAFSPYVIDKVKFINRATPVQYGERISSVIDIQSNYKVAKKVKAGLGFNGLHYDGFISTPIVKHKFSVQLSARRSYADAFKTPTFESYEKRIFQNTTVFDKHLAINESKNISWFYDYTVNAVWKPNTKNRLRFNYLKAKNQLNFSALNADKSNLYIDALNTQSQGYGVEWKREWNDKLTNQIDTYVSKYRLNYQFSNQSNAGVKSTLKQNSIHDFGVNTQFKYKLSNQKQLKAGYQVSVKSLSHHLRKEIINQADETVNTNSIFANYQVNVPQKYLFSVGLRANKYSSSKTYFVEPRVVLQKFVTPVFSINSSLEYKSQFISQIEESVFNNSSLENNIWAITNAENLPVLTSYQYSFGGNYAKNNWVVDLELYFKQTKNISSLQFQFNNSIPTVFDVGNSNIKGIEFFIKKQYNRYHSWFSYTLNSTNYEFPTLNNNKRFPSNVNINNTIKWSHFYKYKHLQFALGWVWHNGKPYTQVLAETNNLGETTYSFDKLNDRKLPNYHRLDFSMLYDFKFRKNNNVKYRLGVSVLNVYNQKNILNRKLQYANNQLYVNAIEGAQITPNLVFRVFW